MKIYVTFANGKMLFLSRNYQKLLTEADILRYNTILYYEAICKNQ